MSEQQKIHRRAIEALNRIEAAIDEIKRLGPDPRDGNNALMNINERLLGLAGRCDVNRR
jgi:hypothetical protein